MQQKYFVNPWAVSGDLTSGGIPNPVNGSGYVSYQQGWTFDYQRNLSSDSAAKAIQRVTMNSVLNDITTALQNLQQFAVPEIITSANNNGATFAYDIGAITRTGSAGSWKLWKSLVTNNTTTPGSYPSGAVNWSPLLSAAEIPHGSQSFAAAGAFNFTVPANVFSVELTLRGPGGAGGSIAAGGALSTGGGSGGGYSRGYVACYPGQVISGVVGSGTTATSCSGMSATAGDSAPGGSSLAGGTNPGVGTGGAVNVTGQAGQPGAIINGIPIGGAGGACNDMSGALGIFNANTNGIGGQFGAGGSGSVSATTGGIMTTGGAGGGGQVVFRW